jgi:hypothetical protein
MIPKFIQPYLWSYDLKKIDLKKDKERIITNILNLGDRKATKWLFKQYSKEEIKEIIKNPLPGEWNEKSLNYWSFILNVKPLLKPRFLGSNFYKY